MDDFGISHALPKITEETKNKVLKRLSELEIEDDSQLKFVNADDLTENNLLPKIQARILVDQWKKG